jgi:HlyD family secretion protein
VLSGQQAIFESRQQVFRSQIAVIGERIGQVEKEISGLKAQEIAAGKRADIARQEVAAVATLVEKGLERRPRLLGLQREAADIEGRSGELAAQIFRAYQVISEARATLVRLRTELQNEIVQSLRDTQTLVLQLADGRHAVADQLSRSDIRAPEAGTVTELRVHTPGGIIGPGVPLLDIVPRQDRLVVMARLRPDDIDVVHEGARAEIIITPFKQRKMPSLKGFVVYVSPDRLLDKRTDQPYYLAKLRIEHLGDVKRSELIPGMPARVFIKTGQSTIAIYALQPLLDSFHSAFREE